MENIFKKQCKRKISNETINKVVTILTLFMLTMPLASAGLLDNFWPFNNSSKQSDINNINDINERWNALHNTLLQYNTSENITKMQILAKQYIPGKNYIEIHITDLQKSFYIDYNSGVLFNKTQKVYMTVNLKEKQLKDIIDVIKNDNNIDWWSQLRIRLILLGI